MVYVPRFTTFKWKSLCLTATSLVPTVYCVYHIYIYIDIQALHCLTKSPGGWCHKQARCMAGQIHIILTNIDGKFIISADIKTWLKLSGINTPFSLLPMHVNTWWFSILLSLYIFVSRNWELERVVVGWGWVGVGIEDDNHFPIPALPVSSFYSNLLNRFYWDSLATPMRNTQPPACSWTWQVWHQATFWLYIHEFHSLKDLMEVLLSWICLSCVRLWHGTYLPIHSRVSDDMIMHAIF